METEKSQRGMRDVLKGKQRGGEGAIVETVEGVPERKVQRPFLSLIEVCHFLLLIAMRECCAAREVFVAC